MDTKARSAIINLKVHYDFPENRLVELVEGGDLTTEELYRVMTTLDFIWSPTRHMWHGLHLFTSLNAARRELASAGKEWARARLEWLMVQCDMLAISEEQS